MTTIADRNHADRHRTDAEDRARRAHVERDQDGAAGERDQRVDRLFGKRRHLRVDDAAMHGVADQHRRADQHEERRRRFHDQPRPAAGGAGELPARQRRRRAPARRSPAAAS